MLAAFIHLAGLLVRPDVVIANTNSVDVETGQVRRGVDVVVRGDRIAYMGPLGMLHAGSSPEVVDGTGKYVIPGLWDMHIHWYDEPTLGLFTANGVIGARVMFGHKLHMEWKKKVESGELIGPHLIVGSPIIDGPNPAWKGSWAVGKTGTGREAIHRVKKEGWEFAKVYTWLPRSAYFEIADESKKTGVPFEGHEPWRVSPKEVSMAGQRTVEHLGDYIYWLSSKSDEIRKALDDCADADYPAKFWIYQADAYKFYDPAKARDTFRTFARNQTWQCPTLVANLGFTNLREYLRVEDPRQKYIPTSFREMWSGFNDDRFKFDPEGTYSAMRFLMEARKRIVREMQREGVGILAGTDCGNPYTFPGFSLHDELALFVQSGLTPLQALRTATSNPARYMEQSSLRGNVRAGMIADLVLLDANPLTDIHNTAKIRAVLQGGRLFRRSDLDGLLQIAEQHSANTED